MPYSLQCTVFAGSANTDPALMSATLDTHGAISSSALPAPTLTIANDADEFYFKHRGAGLFSFRYDAIPDGHVGFFTFLYDGAVIGGTSVNPQEFETEGEVKEALTELGYTEERADNLDALVGTGSGAVLVDHDYGGDDELAYLDQHGVGIVGGTIKAFLTADYDAGDRDSAHVRGQTTTDPMGRWLNPIALDPGDYTLIFYKPGYFNPTVEEITVA
jgi:hypothetical protein